MSASLLNAATPPGAQPGAASGIAAQAAQAGQAKGPLAGFEALLAAFFGDQGLTPPIAGQLAGQAVVQPGAAAPLAGALPVGAPAAKTVGKGVVAAKDALADTTDADKAAAATAGTADAAANAAAGVTLALAAPILPIAQTAATIQATPDGDADAAGQAPDAGLAGKPAATPQIAAGVARTVLVDEVKTAKLAGLMAQDTTASAPVEAGKPAATPAPPPAKTDAAPAPQLPAGPALSSQTPATTAAALPPPTPVAAPAQAKAADAPATAKTAKVARVDGVRTEAPPLAPLAGKAAAVVQAAADSAGKDASASEGDPNAPAAATDAKPAPADATPAQSDFNLAANAALTPSASALAHAAALVRGSPQTVANLAAQIAKKLDGRTSRFDVQLDPAGLGKVDVRVEIDAAGKMTAAMNFDNQQAANELKSRAGELQRALEQAGFDMSGGLSFDVAGQGGQGGRAQDQAADNAPVFRGRAFQAVLDGAAEGQALPSYLSRTSRSGVDIRI